MKENGKRFIQTHAQQDGLANRTLSLIHISEPTRH